MDDEKIDYKKALISISVYKDVMIDTSMIRN